MKNSPFIVFRARSRKLQKQASFEYILALGTGGQGLVGSIRAIRRKETRRRLIVPEHNEFPQVQTVASTGGVLESSFTVRFQSSRRLLRTEHPPVTERPFPYPSYLAPDTFYRRETGFTWQGVELDEWPQTPAPTGAYYPGSGQVFAQRTAFDRKLLTVPEHNEWTVTPAGPAEPYAGWAVEVKAHRWFEVGQYLQSAHLGSYRVTDPAYYAGWYPAGFAAQKANKVWFERKHLRQVEENDFPSTPAPSAPEFVSVVLELAHRRHEHRRLLNLPEHNVWSLKNVNDFGVSATLIEKAFRRQELKRSLRLVPDHDEWTATPVVPIVTLHPAEVQSGFYRRHGKRYLRIVKEFDETKALEPETAKDPLIVQAENTTMIVGKENTTMVVRSENTTLVA